MTLTDSSLFSAIEKRATLSLATLYGFRMLGLFMVLRYSRCISMTTAVLRHYCWALLLESMGLLRHCYKYRWGLLSDKIGAGQLLSADYWCLFSAVLLLPMSDSMTGLIVGRAIQGAGAIASTLMALVSDLTSEENRTKSMAAIGASIGLSFMLAMIFGPLISAVMGLSGIFWVTAVLGLIGVFVFLRFGASCRLNTA